MADIRSFFNAAPTAAAAAKRSRSLSPARGAPSWPDRGRCFDDLEPDAKRQRGFVNALESMQETQERLTQAGGGAGLQVSPSFKKHTPLEKQVIELKAKHEALGCLLAFEVGYKFMFYGNDASVVAQALSIVAYPKVRAR